MIEFINKLKRKNSLKSRFLSKLISNFIGTPIRVIIASLVPRALGMELYGTFNFLTESILGMINFLDFGLSSAFYTKLSMKDAKQSLIRFYWIIFLLTISLFLVFVSLLFIFDFRDLIWFDHKLSYILLAIVWAFLYRFHEIINKVIDAYSLTIQSEIAISLKNLISLALVYLLFIYDKLNLWTFFMLQYFFFLFTIVLWWRILNKNGVRLLPSEKIPPDRLKKYITSFYEFSMPLFIASGPSFILLFLDRWILQKYAGSVGQGIFSLSFKVSVLCFLFTGAIIPLFTREISRAHSYGDIKLMGNLYKKLVPMFYSISVCLGAFCFFNADKITLIIGGEDFQAASISMAIMCLFPIHQTYGQLNSAIYFARSETKQYRNIGLLGHFFGVFLTYVFIAPISHFGFNLGAVGLALKMLIIQFIVQNIFLWYNSKYLNISYFYMLSHQIISIILIGLCSWLVISITDIFIHNYIAAMIFSGILFLIVILVVIYFIPYIFSVNRNDLRENFGRIKDLLFG